MYSIGYLFCERMPYFERFAVYVITILANPNCDPIVGLNKEMLRFQKIFNNIIKVMKSSLSFTDSDLDLLKGDVDAAVGVLEGEIDGELDTARNEINEKIKSLREIMKANAGGGLNEEDATALINDVTQKTNCKFSKYPSDI